MLACVRITQRIRKQSIADSAGTTRQAHTRIVFAVLAAVSFVSPSAVFKTDACYWSIARSKQATRHPFYMPRIVRPYHRER